VALDKLIGLLREAKSEGWKSAKFYFMVGLPPGFDQDEAAPIIDFLREVRAATGMSLNVNVAPYIPKPHTPWERAAQLGEAPAMERILAIRQGLAGDGFKIGYHVPILSLLEGIVSRGDERAGRLVLEAYRRGARLDAWEEHIRLDVWRQVIADADWDVIGETCRSRVPEESLPWAGISLALSASEITYLPGEVTAADRPAMSQAAANTPNGVQPPPQRLVFAFSKKGASAFIGHLDLMTVFERAFARAGYSARFTEGYNPKPRLEFANPLSLGLSSEEEVAGIDLHDFDSEERFVARLNASLPEGLRVLRADLVVDPGPARRRSLMSLYWGADFRLTDAKGESRMMRLPATGPSVRKTLQASGRWESTSVTRISTWATGRDQQPIDYFAALCAPSAGSSSADSAVTGFARRDGAVGDSSDLT